LRIGDAQKSTNASTNGASNEEVQRLKQERDDALAQVAALKKEKGQLEYRILHLLRSLEAEEAKNKQ